MNQTPLRNMTFLCVLLFILLSNGSLQCALNCYDRAAYNEITPGLVADCHPLDSVAIATEQSATFCHHNHASSQATSDPVLSRSNGGPAVALINARLAAPVYRSSEPFDRPQLTVEDAPHLTLSPLPPSQSAKQIRSTILLM